MLLQNPGNKIWKYKTFSALPLQNLFYFFITVNKDISSILAIIVRNFPVLDFQVTEDAGCRRVK